MFHTLHLVHCSQLSSPFHTTVLPRCYLLSLSETFVFFSIAFEKQHFIHHVQHLTNIQCTSSMAQNTTEDKAGDEFEKISPSSSVSIISRDSQDTDTKVSYKKSHGILSDVGSKVKHSISKVKKAITGKSSHPKTPPPQCTYHYKSIQINDISIQQKKSIL